MGIVGERGVFKHNNHRVRWWQFTYSRRFLHDAKLVESKPNFIHVTRLHAFIKWKQWTYYTINKKKLANGFCLKYFTWFITFREIYHVFCHVLKIYHIHYVFIYLILVLQVHIFTEYLQKTDRFKFKLSAYWKLIVSAIFELYFIFVFGTS